MDGDNLIIRAKKPTSSRVIELIPHEMLMDDFPVFLVTDFVHWLEVLPSASQGGCFIEFRPLECLWVSESSPCGWRLYVSDLAPSTMCRGSSTWLLDIRSATVASVYSHLNKLDDLRYLAVTYSSDGKVTVELPRYKLSFFINDESQLESKNLRSMVVDHNQCIGTMFGLSRRLVLKPAGSKEILTCERRARCIIIPRGIVKFNCSGDHVIVEIDIGSEHQVQYFKYRIDSDLGYLAGPGDLTSTLYKIYLHAVTSHCLPDPLTSRTGVEEALRELGSASCTSFRALGADEIDLLSEIHAITPKRKYYPSHLRAMQTVKWAMLSPFTQHYCFSQLSRSIIHHSEALRIFYADQSPLPKEFSNPLNDHLCRRAALRQTLMYPHAHAGVLRSSEDDRPYNSRDLVGNNAEAATAATCKQIHLFTNVYLTGVVSSCSSELMAVKFEYNP